MRRIILGLPLVLVFCTGCAASSPEQSAETPAVQAASPAPESGPEAACETHTAEISLSLSSAEISAGDSVTATIVLQNTGCLALGLPQYRLTVEGTQGVLEEAPAPVVHNLGVAPGASDQVTFILRAASAGEVRLKGSASFEVHVGYPGPAYWGSAATGEPVVLIVFP